LEKLVEATKPVLPPDCRHLDYLLSTPFRYGADYPKGSRFRKAGRTLGVFYASEHVRTAVAEIAFYRLLFFAESPNTPWPSDAAEYTAFSAAIATRRAIDLCKAPFSADRALWTDPLRYGPCQDLADQARAANIELIRTESVRDPERRANLAVLSCSAFAEPRPIERQTWRMRLGPSGVQAICEFPVDGIGFGRDTFVADPRIAALHWERG
jgi:hypothetical protein